MVLGEMSQQNLSNLSSRDAFVLRALRVQNEFIDFDGGQTHQLGAFGVALGIVILCIESEKKAKRENKKWQ